MQPTSAVRCSPAPSGGSTSPSTPPSTSSSLEDCLEPPDVFCNLGCLIVEGRVPKGNGRGFGEGPHVPRTGVGNKGANKHECSFDSYMVS